MWRGIEGSWLNRRSTLSDCGYRDAFALKLRVADLLMASKIMTVERGKIKRMNHVTTASGTRLCESRQHRCVSLLPVLRLELAFIAVELGRNATFLLLMTPPTILCLIKLSALAALVKAYLGFLIKPLRIRIRNGLICSRLALLLLHQLKHHETRELFWNERESGTLIKGNLTKHWHIG